MSLQIPCWRRACSKYLPGRRSVTAWSAGEHACDRECQRQLWDITIYRRMCCDLYPRKHTATCSSILRHGSKTFSTTAVGIPQLLSASLLSMVKMATRVKKMENTVVFEPWMQSPGPEINQTYKCLKPMLTRITGCKNMSVSIEFYEKMTLTSGFKKTTWRWSECHFLFYFHQIARHFDGKTSQLHTVHTMFAVSKKI